APIGSRFAWTCAIRAVARYPFGWALCSRGACAVQCPTSTRSRGTSTSSPWFATTTNDCPGELPRTPILPADLYNSRKVGVRQNEGYGPHTARLALAARRGGRAYPGSLQHAA